MDADDNISAVLVKINDIQMMSMPLPGEIKSDEVLLKTKCVGICGSDVHYWTHGGIGSAIVRKPMILGHETSAVVLQAGTDVTHLKPGDRVAVEPGVPCRYCEFCKSGKYNLCPDIFFFATPPDHGTLTKYFKHPGDFCYKLPEDVTLEEGALIEPLSVAVHACNRAEVTVGDKVLICGAGTIGLVSLITSKAYGASITCITDINEDRLNFAKTLGATYTILLSKDEQEIEIAERIKKLIGDQPNKTIDCCGFESSLKLALHVTKSGGTIVLVGMGQNEVKIPLIDATLREIDIKGIFRYRNCYQKALDLIKSKRVDVKKLVTHRFQFKDTIKAFEKAKTGEGIKIMIHCDDN